MKESNLRGRQMENITEKGLRRMITRDTNVGCSADVIHDSMPGIIVHSFTSQGLVK